MIIKIKDAYTKAFIVRLCNDIGEYNLFNEGVCVFFGLKFNDVKYFAKKNNCISDEKKYNFLFYNETYAKNFSKDIIKLKLFFNGE